MTQLVGGWEDGNPQQGLARAGSAYLSGVEGEAFVAAQLHLLSHFWSLHSRAQKRRSRQCILDCCNCKVFEDTG